MGYSERQGGELDKLTPFAYLGEISVKTFLAEYWQKKPLLVRQAFSQFRSPVSPEELAGFALEDDVESRLIVEQPTGNPLCSDWQITHGPLRETDFELPDKHWTLLVQAVDHLVPEVAELLQRFRFVPNWRLDDVMVSYATDGGNVGPHYDYYDVFLLQGEGRRRWRLGQRCSSDSPTRPDSTLRLLSSFEEDWDAVLEPGDMLYIPPQIAHWGVAEGPCTTYSIGFRAPSYEDILLDYSQEAAADLRPEQRYSDAQASLPNHPGEISRDAVQRVKSILARLISNEDDIAHWLGRYGTEAKRGADLDHAAWPDANLHSNQVQLKARIRAAFIPAEARAQLYVNGELHTCSLDLAQALSSYHAFEVSRFTAPEDKALLRWLLEQGWLWSMTP